MKSKIFLLFFILITCNAICQEYYYYYKGKKVPLLPESKYVMKSANKNVLKMANKNA